MALPKEMREIRRIVLALFLGIVVTLLFSHWARFAEALNIGILVAMVYDLGTPEKQIARQLDSSPMQGR